MAFAAASLVGALSLCGCKSSAGAGPAGSVGLAVTLAGGASVGSVSYLVTGPSAFSTSGAFDVSSSDTVSAVIGPLPAGNGYSIALSATSTDGTEPCAGSSAPFDVTAHATTTVTVTLRCHEPARDGSLVINGTLNVCPTADGVTATPDEVLLGGTISLAALAHDPDSSPSPLAYAWTVSPPGAGTLGGGATATPTFTCALPGPVTLSFTVTDGDPAPACTDTASVTVTCTANACGPAPAACAGVTTFPGTVCADGTHVATCSRDASGCVIVSPPVPCSASKTCQGAAGVAACVCGGPGITTCTASQVGSYCLDGTHAATCTATSDGCFVSSAPAACGPNQACQGAAPSAACACDANACTAAGAFCVDASTIATCATSADGCLLQGSSMPCPAGTACQGAAGAAMCVSLGTPCQQASDCPATGNACVTPLCAGGICGTMNQPPNMPLASQTSGDCQTVVCDGHGGMTSVADDTDVPADDGNFCTSETCNAGVPAHPNKASGTVTPNQTAGDCQANVCDGQGNTTSTADNGDVPADDGNPCTSETCNAGAPAHPNTAALSACSANGGVVCDGAGVCTNTVDVVRVGDGSGALSSAAAAVFVEQRFVSTGALAPTSFANPLALPTAVNGSNARLTMSGSATSEGALALSGNGHYVTLAGYDAATGTSGVASSTGVNRVGARIDASGNVDTTTKVSSLYNGNNVRSAVTNDGTQLWFGGPSAGVVYVPFGTSGGTAITSNTTNDRSVEIANGQLYGSASSGSFFAVFTVGTGLPTTAGQTATTLPGMPTSSGPSPYGFAFAGSNVVYVADDRAVASGGGVQKWTKSGSTWSLATTFKTGGLAQAARGVAAFVTGSTTTVLATSAASSANTLVVFVDDGVNQAPTVTTLATAATNTIYRGVAPAPR
ncbi:MAG TPA: hypothetical protein VHL80_21715 [Polyangia bacterium]|nr:hypothetical protein [Polyangia bacterium]